jgi:hypothetical protein
MVSVAGRLDQPRRGIRPSRTVRLAQFSGRLVPPFHPGERLGG